MFEKNPANPRGNKNVNHEPAQAGQRYIGCLYIFPYLKNAVAGFFFFNIAFLSIIYLV